MAVAEIIISSFISVIMEKLATAVLTKLAPSDGIDSQLDTCKKMLSLIRSLLVDAGKKQITDKAVQLWLDHLQDLAYDVDDILDDLATEAHRRRSMEGSESSSKVRKVASSFSRFRGTVKYGQEMSSKLEDIARRLDDLLEKKNSLGLNENVEKPIGASSRRRESSLLEPIVIGREEDKEVLLKKLLGSETCNQNVCIVPIVGMGGIGKTTLARLLYNDEKVKHHFELRVWVCVSDEFDVFMISKIVFHAVTGMNGDFPDLNSLQVALQDKLSKKSFLLVLDDVWNEDGENWDRLQRPFQAGARGSKVIVTTRSGKVVSTMGRVQDNYSLGVLSSHESLSLFAQHALGERNFDAYPTLRPHGEGIVRKCKGLPLALITLGRALSTTVNEEEWEELMNSEIWSSQEDKYEILPALKLSYHYLPLHLKLLFAYSCLFPKDYMFDKDEIVLLWMAEGFLHDSDGKRTMESIGFECFEELLSRSFFQRSPNEESRYIMHDLMNELATSVAGRFFFRLDDIRKGEEKDESLEKLCYFSFIRQPFGVYRKFTAFQKAKRLRTFLPMSVRLESWQMFYLSNKVLVELLPQLHFLRVLSLSGYRIKEIPDSIARLKLLRYLNLSHTEITRLPEEFSKLHNLQTLLLHDCKHLTMLPNSFVSLVNLRHLDISDTPKLKKMPFGIGCLTSLQTLSKVIIEETEAFKIAELRGLLDLRGRLSIEGLDKVKTGSHAKESNLVQKKSIHDLEMEWSDKFDGSRNEKIEFEVLEALRPHDKLKQLGIIYYGGKKFPSWVGDPSFERLTQVTLRGCRSTFLPSLGHLRSLQKLFIADMVCVKTIGCELLGTSNCLPVIAFPTLEILEFSNMKGLEKWSTESSDNNKVFPCLLELKIHGCPKLVEVLIQSVPSIRGLDIAGCSEEVLRSVVRITSSLTKLSIGNIAGLIQLQGIIKFLRGVEELKILYCNELRYLWESEAEACKILVNLRKLDVWWCRKLISLGEKEEEEEVNKGNNLTSLRELVLYECPRLECFSIKRIEDGDREGVIFPNLERLDIYYCSGMNWFPTGHKKLPSTLKSLRVFYCQNLCWWESKGGGGENSSSLLLDNMSSLEFIWITNWPNLKSLLSGLRLFIHLTTLLINDCEGIECLPEQGCSLPQGLRYLTIENCKDLKWFADDELQSLTSLVKMTIIDCPSLDSDFPRGVWPPNLSSLEIGGLKKPMTKWGQQNFPTSLVHLTLRNESCLVSFAEPKECLGNTTTSSSSNPTTTLFLPSSLTQLEIYGFEELESVSKGLRHLTSLQQLEICNCPKLGDLPETLLPQLSRLYILTFPKLKERCSISSSSSSKNRKDSYWSRISHIPCLDVLY